MKHINEVRISGNVGKLDFKETTKTAVLNISVACNQNRKVNDEWVTDTDWFNVTTFGDTAERLNDRLKTGDTILVSGRLKTNTYEVEGEKRKSTNIIAYSVDVLQAKADRPNQSQQEEDNDSTPF